MTQERIGQPETQAQERKEELLTFFAYSLLEYIKPYPEAL